MSSDASILRCLIPGVSIDSSSSGRFCRGLRRQKGRQGTLRCVPFHRPELIGFLDSGINSASADRQKHRRQELADVAVGEETPPDGQQRVPRLRENLCRDCYPRPPRRRREVRPTRRVVRTRNSSVGPFPRRVRAWPRRFPRGNSESRSRWKGRSRQRYSTPAFRQSPLRKRRRRPTLPDVVQRDRRHQEHRPSPVCLRPLRFFPHRKVSKWGAVASAAPMGTKRCSWNAAASNFPGTWKPPKGNENFRGSRVEE